jgi:two-component system, chemotaxis family, sensor kinase CheA
MDDLEAIKDFLIESAENLARLDQEMVELEQRPRDPALLASVFRTIHTIKGTSGFFGFDTLGQITHLAENLLSEVRDGRRELTTGLVSLILHSVDAVKELLEAIEETGKESGRQYRELRTALEAAWQSPGEAPVETAIPEAEGERAAKAGVSDTTIRVDVGLLDKLMNLVGELVLARNQILQFNAGQDNGAFNATSQRLNLITTELQENVMKTRMQPIGMVWNKLPRVVRDLAQNCGKQVQLDMEGAETELDKTLIEAIKDPLTHLVRNACDHGIERPEQRAARGKASTGRLSMRAYHEGGQVNIEVSDDGAGIDPVKIAAKAVERGLIRADQASRMSEREALNLVFLPGFSTAAQVTSISGRGVGMDVVKTNIEKIGGTVDLSSRLGEGTTVKIKIPLTLAIIPGLVVYTAGERFVIPQVSLLELIRLEGEGGGGQVERVQGAPVYRRRGQLLPLADLNQLLGLQSARERNPQSDVMNIVVLQAEDRQFGLLVDGISDTQEIVVKPLGKHLKGLSVYAGATIMGDGRVALILDVPGVAERSGVLGGRAGASSARAQAQTEAVENERRRLLLFRAGRSERLAVPLETVARLEEIHWDRIEKAGSRQVVQYRGEILPLVDLVCLLDRGAPERKASREPVHVVVISDGARRAGLMVDQIVDIVDERIEMRQASRMRGLLGSVVVGGRVTDLLDLHMAGQEAWGAEFAETRFARKGLRVLIADASAFGRGLVRERLEMEGMRVLEAASPPEAAAFLDKDACDVLLLAQTLAGADALAAQASRKAVSSIRLTGSEAEAEELRRDRVEARFQFDAEGLLTAVQRSAPRGRPAGIGRLAEAVSAEDDASRPVVVEEK